MYPLLWTSLLVAMHDNIENTSINASIRTVQSLEKLHTFILWQPRWWAKGSHQLFFRHHIIENFTNILAHKSVFVGPNDLEFGTETSDFVLQTLLKVGGN